MNILTKISEKIEDVRNQPESIRMRYVWGSVAISMIVVVSIWIFSLGSLFQGDKNNKGTNESGDFTSNITEQLQELKKQAPSLKDVSESSISTINEGISGAQKKADSEYSGATGAVDAPQASAYSELSSELQAQ
ncbi:MAG: hypothetical protein ACD_67C00246G0002 [uncultured bacterium]|nr:MAG: hypothetical protein ACD_67C00246G0002 [uncultured bacterium]